MQIVDSMLFVLSYYKVNGGWGGWGSWGRCSASCGGGKQTRTRKCDSPEPSLGGQSCIGDEFQTRTCNSNSCCRDIWTLKKCRKQKKKCRRSNTVKRNCKKTCKICTSRTLGNIKKAIKNVYLK